MAASTRIPFRQLLGRALRLRCPVCGDGRLFRGYLKMNDVCPDCGYVHAREGGYWLGAMYVNYGVVVAVSMAAHLVMTDSFQVPVTIQMAVLVPGAAALVLLFAPWARALWLALDLMFAPPKQEDHQRAVDRAKLVVNEDGEPVERT